MVFRALDVFGPSGGVNDLDSVHVVQLGLYRAWTGTERPPMGTGTVFTGAFVDD